MDDLKPGNDAETIKSLLVEVDKTQLGHGLITL